MNNRTCLLILLLMSMPLAAQQFPPEQLRAPFLYHIAYYSTFSGAKSNGDKVNFCFLEGNTFAHMNQFERSPSKTVRKRAVNILAIENIEQAELNQCHVLFVAKTQESEELYRKMESINAETISVGESAEFIQRGGMMSVLPTNSKMKIYLNQEQYQNTSIKFSANLLKRVIFR